jgi:hypothetical protein
VPIWTSLSSAVDQRRNMLRFSRPTPAILLTTEQLKTDDSQRRCNLRFPYRTGRSHSNRLLEQMPRSGDRRASARMALIATSPLRSTQIVTPRHSSAPAKSMAMCYPPFWCECRLIANRCAEFDQAAIWRADVCDGLTPWFNFCIGDHSSACRNSICESSSDVVRHESDFSTGWFG